MRRPLALTTVLALLAGAALAHELRVSATTRPTCNDGAPLLVYIVDASADDDCDGTGGGTTEAPCLCLDGAYVAMLAGGAPDIDAVTGQSSWDTAATKKTVDLTIDGVEVDFEAGTAEGYPRLAQSTTPPAGDCDAAGEAGRLYFDSDADTTGSVYICTGAGGWKDIDDDGGAGGSIAFDKDDDGDDSSAVTELATINDSYRALDELSADKVTFNGRRIAPYNELDLDRPPAAASCFLCDEFTGGSSLTWAWGNQDSATAADEYDGHYIDGVGTFEIHARYIDPAAHTMPTNADQVFCAKVTPEINVTNERCYIGVVAAGTGASPTDISVFGPANAGTDGETHSAYTSYAFAGSTSIDQYAIGYDAMETAGGNYLKLSYTDSTRALMAAWSFDGKHWFSMNAADTLSGDPVTWFIASVDTAHCFFDFARLRTDANREECGE